MEQVIGELRQGLGSENIPQRPNVENVRFDVMQARIMDALHKFNGYVFLSFLPCLPFSVEGIVFLTEECCP